MATLAGIVVAQRERSKTFAEMARNSLYFFRDFESYDEKTAKKTLTADTAPTIRQAREALAKLASWTAPAVHDCLSGLAASLGVNLGKIAQPLRVAVAGGSVSPPIDQTLALAGRDRVLARIDRALAYAEKSAAM
jgi:glutamyl-tRNA synthetase